jgi:hypothetical protein
MGPGKSASRQAAESGLRGLHPADGLKYSSDYPNTDMHLAVLNSH